MKIDCWYQHPIGSISIQSRQAIAYLWALLQAQEIVEKCAKTDQLQLHLNTILWKNMYLCIMRLGITSTDYKGLLLDISLDKCTVPLKSDLNMPYENSSMMTMCAYCVPTTILGLYCISMHLRAQSYQVGTPRHAVPWGVICGTFLGFKYWGLKFLNAF